MVTLPCVSIVVDAGASLNCGSFDSPWSRWNDAFPDDPDETHDDDGDGYTIEFPQDR